MRGSSDPVGGTPIKHIQSGDHTETGIVTGRDRMLPVATAVGLKVAAAFVLCMVGRWPISMAIIMLSRVLTARKLAAGAFVILLRPIKAGDHAPTIEILDFDGHGTVLAIRPCRHTDD